MCSSVTGLFHQHNVFKVCQCCSMSQYYIPFCCPIIFPSMFIPHFQNSSINGHLGSFHFLVIMHNASVNIHVRVCVWTFLLGTQPGVKFLKSLGHMATVWLNLLRNCTIDFQRNTPFHSSTSSVGGTFSRWNISLHPHQHLLLSIFDFGLPRGCEVVSSLPFLFAFPRTNSYFLT